MISLISVRSSSLRSRSVVVSAAHRRGRSRASRASAWRSAAVSGSGRRALELGELAPFALQLRRAPPRGASERAGDEAVLGLARVELALRALGLELGALDREPLAGQALFVLLARARRSPRCAARPRPG